MSAYSIATRGLAGRKVPQGVLTPMGELLFSASEPGAFYDPSDMSTLFQDSAGTVPVTAVEQPVGLILDKSKGLALGPELVTNGDFSNGTTGWSAYNAVISAVNGTLKVDDSSNLGYSSSAVQQLNLVAGRTYLLTFDVVSVSGAWSIGFATTDSSVGITFPSAMLSKNTTGPQRFVFTYDGTRNFLFMDADGSGIVFYDNISVKELPGNHATQATTTKRPVLSRRVNLLTKTEQFDNGDLTGVVITASGDFSSLKESTDTGPHGAWPPVSVVTGVEYVVSCRAKRGEGTRNLAINIAGGAPGAIYNFDSGVSVVSGDAISKSSKMELQPEGDFYCELRFVSSYTFPTSVRFLMSRNEITSNPNDMYVGDGTSSILIKQIDFRLATDAHLPYQRVNTDTDYDADPAKFPAYLRWDGVDDAMQTGNIDFTGTDKMTVWAGMNSFTQQNGTALGTVVLHPDTGISSFAIYAPINANNLAFNNTTSAAAGSAGSASTIATNSNAVVAGIADLATRTATLRANGVQLATGTAASGGGNYRNGPLYIGGQIVANRHFNGRIYQLIARGAQSSLSQIEAAEAYIKQKMRLP